jgi:transposase InsO family protein
VRFAFIHAEKANFPIAFMCRQLEVSRSGYHAWAKRPESTRARQDKTLAKEVASIFEENKHRYGSPRVQREMRARGRCVGRKRVARLMRMQGLAARRRARFVRTTDSNHGHPVAPNLLDRNFSPPEPQSTWAGDITYVWTSAGWVYLAVLLDLFSRKVVGWAVKTSIDTELVLSALNQGLYGRRDVQGLLHHTDRGSQYASGDYQGALKARGIACSMSRKGNCWDNAVVESFFATLKKELIYKQSWTNKTELQQALFEYIEVFYNRKRRHSSLGYVSPAEYEKMNQGLSHAA